tara:strand:+ start:159 stop:395 length:237 start_codon:yes stop_codon:yes gene_type:complete
MIDKSTKKVIRTRYGDANFKYVEKFNSVEKAADPSNEGELVEVKVSEIKWDFTKVKEDADGKHQKSSAETDGQTKKEK